MNVFDRERRFRVPDLPPPPAPVEQAAFLRWAQRQEGRYELVKGRVVMMTGVSRNHAKVALRIAALLYASLDRTLFQVSSTDFGVQFQPASVIPT